MIATQDCAAPVNLMRFSNGDVSLDEAVEWFRNSGEELTPCNSDLLYRSIMNTPWDKPADD